METAAATGPAWYEWFNAAVGVFAVLSALGFWLWLGAAKRSRRNDPGAPSPDREDDGGRPGGA